MIGLDFMRNIFMLAVLNIHNAKEYKWGNNIFDGDIAVRLSFVISGFYMEMVYPKYKNFISFFISRIVRIYPCYFLNVLVGNYLQKKNMIYFIHKLPNYLTERNKKIFRYIDFSLLFKDFTCFLYQNKKKELILDFHCKQVNQALYWHITNKQSWSMGTEWNWYLLVPIISKFNNFFLTSTFFYFFAKRSYDFTYKNNTFNYFSIRYFPYLIYLFIAGQMLYRIYSTLLPSFEKSKKQFFPTFLITFILIKYQWFKFMGEYFVITLFCCLLPYIFYASKDSKVDRWFGERAYSIFTWHFLVKDLLEKYYGPKLKNKRMFLLIQYAICFVISIVFEEFIQKKINFIFKPKYVKPKSHESDTKNDEEQLLKDKFILYNLNK